MKSTFPKIKAELALYFAKVVAYIIAQATRLQILPTKVADLITLYGSITTDDTYLYYLSLWGDKEGKRTDIVIKSLETKEKAMKKLLTQIYDDIPASLWTDADREIFGRRTGAPPEHKAPPEIKEECYGRGEALGGGKVALEFRKEHDASLPSKPEGADALLLFYRSVDKYKQGAEIATKTRNLCTSPYDEGMKQFISSKAKFTLLLGIEAQDLELQYFGQWINTKHPELNGPISGPFFLNIL